MKRSTVRRALAAAALSSACVLVPVGAATGQSAESPVVTTVIVPPAGSTNGYLPSRVPIAQGTGLALAALDTLPHDITSYDLREDGTPLFYSDAIPRNETIEDGPARVRGVEELAPGSYDFFCSIHPNMVGTLIVAGAE